jgi:hypothetical protein
LLDSEAHGGGWVLSEGVMAPAAPPGRRSQTNTLFFLHFVVFQGVP